MTPPRERRKPGRPSAGKTPGGKTDASPGLLLYLDMMERWSGRTFLVGRRGYREEPWTFCRVHRACLKVSRELGRRGLRKGDRVLLAAPPSPRWVAAYFGVLHRGGVVVPLDHESSPDFLAAVYEKTQPALVIAGDEETGPSGGAQASGRESPLSLVLRTLPGIEERCIAVSRVGSSNGVAPEGARDAGAHDAWDATGGEPHPADIGDGDLAQIVFTSGTTARPKGVMLTHRNIRASLEPLRRGVEEHLRIVRLLTPFRLLCTIPYSHMFGQAAGIFLPILIGSTVYFARDTSPASLVRTIRRDRILTLITVPRVMRLLKEHVETVLESRGRLDSFRRRWDRWVNLPYPIRWLFYLDARRVLGLRFWSFIVGATPLDDETHEFWRRLVCAVFQGYGLTETAPLVTMFNPFRHDRRSVGKLFPGLEVKVENGEIHIRGENVMAGYYGDTEATGRVLEGGWLKTGDMGEIDEQGQLYIKGRKKEMIVTAEGRNVFPEDLEVVLDRVPGVRGSVVIGRQARGGEVPHAVLLLEPGTDPDRVLERANRELQPFQRVRSYTLWEGEDFPRTPTTGKVRRREVVRAVAGGPEEEGKTREEADVLREITGGAGPDARLVADLGLDSLDLVEAVSAIEKKYGVSLDESAITPDTTVADLEKLAAGRGARREAAGRPVSGGPALRGPALSMPRWNRRAPAAGLRALAQNLVIIPGFRLLCSGLTVEGLDTLLEGEGPCILAANHTSDLDPLAVLGALPPSMRRLVAPAMGLARFRARFGELGRRSLQEKDRRSTNGGGRPQEEAGTSPGDGTTGAAGGGDSPGRRPLTRRLAGLGHGLAYFLLCLLFQAYPFPQATAYRASMEYTGELLDLGRWVLLFPEGEVSAPGRVGRFRGGVGALAANTGVPVYPVALSGVREIFRDPETDARRLLPRRSRVRVAFGPPLEYRGEDYGDFACRLREEVARLLG
ncbi:MAG: AMP-binding protein [Spirochaetota bacterium]